MTIHAFTELHNNFPAFINLSEQPDGTIKVSVRTRGNDGKGYATIALTALQAEELADSIYKYNYKGEGEIDLSRTAAPVPASEAASIDTPEFRELVQNVRHGMHAQTWPPLIAYINARIAAPAVPIQASEGANVREFVEAVAAESFTYIDRETDEACCNGCNMAAQFVSIEEGFRQHHAPDCIVLRARAYLAAPAAQPDQIRHALQIAMNICDSVPTRLHNDEDETFARIGRLINAQPDGSHGYAVIRDALAACTRQADIPHGAALGANGVTYHGIEEIYHRMEEGEALHMWLDDAQVPRADADEKVYSLVGRVQQYAAAPTDAQPECQAKPGEWSKCQMRTIEAYNALQPPRQSAQSVRDTALEEAARNVEDFQADNGEVSFNDIALSIRALIQSPSVRDAAQPFREPTDEERHLEGVEKLMASAQPTIAPEDARDAAMNQAARDVLAERRRQVQVEGWSQERDDEYQQGELARAAAAYAYPELTAVTGLRVWPWAESWWKPRDGRSNCVRAGALLLAEIERLDRSGAATTKISKE